VVVSDGRRPHSKERLILQPGTEVILRLPGGGGYGDPFERDPELVRADVVDGYVSVEAARTAYGVVIDPATLEVDWEATRALRGGARPRPAAER
jgi:N-methylhydantoinase B